MELSVVVPTLNGRDRLAACLDALAAATPETEVIVANGPSTDGTTGMIRDRDDVDVLVELADRPRTVACNAGIEAASGDAVAFVDDEFRVESGWVDAVREGLSDADAVTGPTHRPVRAGVTTESAEEASIAGQRVVHVDGGNVALRREVLDRLDGFDEYLESAGARDLAHRLAGTDAAVEWLPAMCVEGEPEPDGGSERREWRLRYRGLAYRLVKNYGLRPTVVRRVSRLAARDAVEAAVGTLKGRGTPTAWVGNGRDVVGGIATGASDGLVARARDRSTARNPHGLSARADRAVARYDWR